jgi:hypothetical protein
MRSSNAAAMISRSAAMSQRNKPVSNEAEINKVMLAIGQLFLGGIES